MGFGFERSLELLKGISNFVVMRGAYFLIVTILTGFFSSCGVGTVVEAELSEPEKNLLAAINNYRLSQGKQVLRADASLMILAREDALRRVSVGEDYVDNLRKTGYERMLTLVGQGQAGEQFGMRLMGNWQRHPIQRKWLGGSYARVGVGTAVGPSGERTGVLLLGGFSGDGI